MDKSVLIASQEESLVEEREVKAEPETETVGEEVGVNKPRGYVGIDCLIKQLVDQTIGDGYLFNLLIVGEPGVGKSTLIDSLLDLKVRTEGPALGDDSENSSPSCSPRLVSTHFRLLEKHVKVSLNVIETKDFGNGINKSDSFQRVVEYIDLQMENRLNDELLVRREADFGLKDSLIHCCLYLLPPVGHGIRSVDMITMKALLDKVNLIPIVAKADGLTQSELLVLKQTIRREIESNHIQVYAFPSNGEPAEEAEKLPYAVVGSHDFHCVHNKQVRGRAYNWGFVEVENESHFDLIKLKRKLFGENLVQMKETTLSSHYEKYRVKKLESIGYRGLLSAQFEKEEEQLRRTFERRLKEKEDEIDQKMKQRVKWFEDEKQRIEKEGQLIHEEGEALGEKMKAFEEEKRVAKAAEFAAVRSVFSPNAPNNNNSQM